MGKYFTRDKWKFLFHTISHPVDGYYEIRHRDRGSVPIAILMVILFSLCFSMNRMMAAFVVNDIDPREVDSFTELGAVLLLFALFCVGNWSVTCLMEGEGRLKDIAIAFGYALTPMTVSLAAATAVSPFIAADEEAFYYIILVIGAIWAAALALIGVMEVHNYTLAKTLLTLLLTFIAVLLIIFLLLLLADMLNQVVGFFRSIYYELIFRA